MDTLKHIYATLDIFIKDNILLSLGIFLFVAFWIIVGVAYKKNKKWLVQEWNECWRD